MALYLDLAYALTQHTPVHNLCHNYKTTAHKPGTLWPRVPFVFTALSFLSHTHGTMRKLDHADILSLAYLVDLGGSLREFTFGVFCVQENGIWKREVIVCSSYYPLPNVDSSGERFDHLCCFVYLIHRGGGVVGQHCTFALSELSASSVEVRSEKCTGSTLR